MIHVTVWNENVHEKTSKTVQQVHPNGLHNTLKEIFETEEDMCVTTATLDMPECGLTDSVLAQTDVLVWWGHCAHDDVPDEIVQKVHDRVLTGMGLIVLHSGHYSKIFRKLMGTSCSLRWRDNDFERVWCMDPSHPITQGVDAMFELELEEMYGEAFDIPTPDEVVYGAWFRGGEIFRALCTFKRGAGRIVYFQPGHETNRSYYNENVRKILRNSVRYVKPVRMRSTLGCFHTSKTTEELYREGASFAEYMF